MLDTKKRKLNEKQKEQLQIIAKQVMTHLDLHRQNRELKLLNENKVKLMKMLSHDMRSPLNGIIGVSSMLREMFGSENEEELVLIEIIEQGSGQRNQMIDEIMSYTIIESEGLQLDEKETHMGEMVADILKLYRPSAKIKEIQLDFYTENLDRTVVMVGNKFEQIIGNLLSNAIKYTETGGRVNVSLIGNKEELELTVSDTGIGKSETKLSRLFKEGE